MDKNPIIAARYHGDKHVVKMIIESAQMLSTAHHVLPSTLNIDSLYKKCYENHPCNQWIRESSANYMWTWELLNGLCYEFVIRRKKNHKTQDLLYPLQTLPDIPHTENITPPALAMPDIYKVECPVESYRKYYRQKYKDGIATYNWHESRKEPEWLLEGEI